MDWKYRNEAKIITRATSNVSDGNIILMHETYKQTKNALEDIIKILKEKDFVFVTISELEQIKTLRKYNE
jgi:peptidoglycan/xylan/chitin deacetylase (PgdA/CDA1 family)